MSSETQVLDLVNRWAEAELHGDADAFDDLLGADFAGIGPVGFVLDKGQWAGRHRGDLKNHHFAILQPSVRLHGDTAIVGGIQEQRTSVRGHDVDHSFRLTLVAVRRGDDWVIANIQLSGPLQDPSAPPPFARPGGRVARDELRASIEAKAVTVVDALPAAPYRRRHLPGALNLTAEDAAGSAGELLPDRTAPIVAYSTDADCDRGPALVAELTRLGYANVRLYADGIEDWAAAGLPLETGA
ncbi:DUF4440 domain-containing protein [Nonomuraea sp. SMC257]|uniref:DUF4440 domain-containing protein n=1 Tax=Nonomuraea montanisoli TaxID=2741721 RepID=A0A7Y6I5H6_9ACTN|nr:DUF4440 domain-containing protein [Nonomuraea montanisoli]NUW31934.1 DUF4440 domain-containing protein [Nonomuraea montanisoli]